jgi:hypothetical protein
MRKVVLYIVYGDNPIYYEGVKFSFITFMNWISKDDEVEIVILSEKPDYFSSYPVKTFLLTEKQKYKWSIEGHYHFRIKNRGLAYIMDKLELENDDKILFFDADTYFIKSPLKLFDMINPSQAVFYLNEGLIHKRKRFHAYVDNLDGKSIFVNDQLYKLNKNSAMWGSLMVGIMPNMRHSLDWADSLMLELYKLVPVHTIEPFSLSESLLRSYKIIEGKRFINLYSTSRKKVFAALVLSDFSKRSRNLPLHKQIALAQETKIKRSMYTLVKQRIESLSKK